ncbi:MAG TPA: arabinofuranosidase catalytic domain-containing protein, partial [Polyangia bacterium]|nr:arabinofuranosidase catalytic domain-containing protein [Polyangia bacterium]
ATGSGGALGSGGAPGSGGGSSSGGTVGSGGSSAAGGTAGSGATGPCDLYQAGNTPCAAAHSTVRALYGAYTGPLYQVQRASDKSTKDILVGSGGFADTSVQDSFCSGTTCTIPIIYDQSPNGNHLRVTWFAYWLQSGGNPASATAAKITVGGHSVYGVKSGTNVAYRTGVALSGTASVNKGSSTVTFSAPQTLPANSALLFAANSKDCPANSWPNNCNFRAYFTTAAITASTTVTLTSSYTGTSAPSTAVWNQTTKGVATGDAAEAIYSVFDGKTYSSWCCFDYGNSELPGVDDGNGTMEAIYWGADTQFGQSGGGSGPWVAADLENGMYEGYENGSSKVASNTSVTGVPYLTAMLKGLSAKDCPAGLTSSGCFALKAGNATSGKLAFKFDADTMNYGARPPGYSPQKKEGAIILGTGGDGSNSGAGIWFEGAMTIGAPSDTTDDAVQANIVAAGYGH